MSSGTRVGSSAAVPIPSNARKVVQDLKEIVKNSEDEIYAMLKECNMDPNETAQRLLTQDTFHEVKRKRDKKKEIVSKDAGEAGLRPSVVGSSVRGGRVIDRGPVRGNYVPRYNSELSGSGSGSGRGQAFTGRDNSLYQRARAPNVNTPTSLMQPRAPNVNILTSSVQPQAQIKTGSTVASGSNTAFTAPTSGAAGVPNGGSSYTKTPQGHHGSWSSVPGQATMADVVKSSNLQQFAATAAAVSSTKSSAPHQPALSGSDVSSAVYSSSTDPILHSYLESHGKNLMGIKEDTGVVGNQQGIGEKAPMLYMETSAMPDSLEQSAQTSQPCIEPCAFSSETDDKAADADIATTSVSPSPCQEQSVSEIPGMEVGGSSEGPVISPLSGSIGSSEGRATSIPNQYNGRLVYQIQHQPMGSPKGSGLEWKPKSPVKSAPPSHAVVETPSLNEAARPSPPASPHNSPGMLLDSASKLQQLSIQDDQPVIIPNHLQVSEADRTHLSFGSFGEELDSTFHTDYATEDDSKGLALVGEESTATVALDEQPSASSLMSSEPMSLEQNYSNQSNADPVETLVGGEGVAMSLPVPAVSPVVSRPEMSKPEPVVHQTPQYPYLSALPSYPGFGVVPQIMGGQYTYEPAESQPQDISRQPSFVSPYSDPGVNYYSPVFRHTSDVDVRYTQFVTTNAANKYNSGVALITGQGLSSSQEGGNPIVIPASGPTGQTSQTMGITQTGLRIPQHHVPIHAYPAQHAAVPLTPFGTSILGFQYVPPSYGYMPTLYQHGYTGNTGYPQAPSGSAFTPAGNAAYAPPGGATIKYSLPQFKPATAAPTAPHTGVAAGYGSFTTSPAGFATANPAVTAVTASGYDDASGPHFKESNLYIPGQQQAEGSTVWVQTQLSRDMTGIQTNSFYNVLGQAQHTAYAHTQPMHAVPAAAYSSLYHQSQSGTAPTVHQLLQQPQALGAVAGGGVQSGAYQQPQRGQLNWPNNY